jgi:hypothetical protein
MCDCGDISLLPRSGRPAILLLMMMMMICVLLLLFVVNMLKSLAVIGAQCLVQHA